MSIQETLTEIRDAAWINQHALTLIGEQAQAHFDQLRLLPTSSVQQAVLRQLSTTITAYKTAQREAMDLYTCATEALQSYSEDPVPPPPDFPDLGSVGWAGIWSVEEW